MNNQLFQQARAAYAQKDFQGALEVLLRIRCAGLLE